MPPKELAITIMASFITAEIPKPEYSKTAPKIQAIIKIAMMVIASSFGGIIGVNYIKRK